MSAIHRGKFVTKLLEFKRAEAADESSTDPDPADAAQGSAPVAAQPTVPICMSN
jgi:hypothetical protein